MKFFISILCIFVVSLIASGQSYHFQNYNVKDGLSQSNVTCGVQSDEGYLWLGTDGGVSKFDGKNFLNYSISSGFIENNASALFQDSEGIIWVGHQNGGISTIEGTKIVGYSDTILSKNITKIIEDQQGNIWICTLGDGVVKITSKKDKRYIRYKGKEGLSDFIFNAFVNEQGEIWFVTDVGIKRIDREGKFEFYKIDKLPPFQITSVIQTKQKELWIGTYQGGVYRYNIQTKELVSYTQSSGLKSNWISSLYESKSGVIWVGTWGGGISQITKDGEIKSYYSGNGLPDDKIRFISEDREENILIGTNEHGLVLFVGEEFKHYTKKDGLLDDQVWSVLKMKDKIFIGSNKGVNVLEGNNVTTIERLKYPVRSLQQYKNRLIIATWGYGVYEYNVKTKLIRSFPDINNAISLNINSIYVNNENLWIGTIKGLSKYNLKTNDLESFPGIIGKVELDVAKVFIDSKNVVWLGTRKNGLIKYDGEKFETVGENKILSAPTSISENKENNTIYIGTEGDGIFDVKNEKKITHQHGLISDYIISLKNKGDFLWIATNKGLCRMNLVDSSFVSYGIYEGFSAIESKLNAIDSDSNHLYIGTIGGLSIYQEKKEKKTSALPKTLITNVKVNLKEVEVKSSLELDYKENSLVFEYVGISLKNPEKVNYLIKLEGWDKNWIATPLQRVNYSNLPAGDYYFLVKSGNPEVGWDKEVKKIKFTINPPFWQTWWFYALCILFIVIGFILYVKWREARLREEKKILEEKVEKRTIEVVEKSEELEKAYNHIKSSIVYAQRIQNAILPTDKAIKDSFPNSFVYFKPRDIVSGDFYWLEKTAETILFAAIDCTGHGVPGAFVSMVGHNLLNQSVRKHNLTKPSDILNDLDNEVKNTLQTSDETSVKDGMDLALCSFCKEKMQLQYAGAHNPLYLVRDGELIVYKANRFAIGYKDKDEGKRDFTNHVIDIREGDTIYLFSDGYIDQFGGELGRKFMSKKFKQLLIAINNLSLEKQKEELEKVMSNWMSDLHKQIDDILVFGIRF